MTTDRKHGWEYLSQKLGTLLDIINIHLFVTKLECTVSVFLAKGISLVDLGVLWQFAVCFDWI